MQAWVFIRPAEELIKNNKWSQALASAQKGIGKVGKVANEELKSWRINAFIRWSVAAIEQKDFESAARAVDDGLKIAPKDSDFSITWASWRKSGHGRATKTKVSKLPRKCWTTC